MAHFDNLESRLETMLDKLKELEGPDGKGGTLAELKEERDAALADFRSEYLQQEYGKDVLRQLKNETEAAYKKCYDEVGILKVEGNRTSGRGLKIKIYQLDCR